MRGIRVKATGPVAACRGHAEAGVPPPSFPMEDLRPEERVPEL